eukprot:gene29480-33130_t
MLTTLVPPSSGSARVAGFDIVRDPARVRAHIGYVPQLLSAYENLLMSARLYAIPRTEREARIATALQQFDLADVADKLVQSYSGGMIRRLEIAQSMIHEPAVLFMDEPTVGLDPVARHNVWQHIRNLRDRMGTTILVTTHLMDEAGELCDRLGILHGGRLEKTGTPAELERQVGPGATLDDVPETARAPIPDLAALGGAAAYVTQVLAVADTEIRKLRHDPGEIFTRALQPVIWLLLFGEVMAQVKGMTTANGSYLDFLAPGILAQSVLFAAIFYGIAAIWERDLGVLHRYMVSPAPRSALVLGKAVSSGVRGLTQAIVVYALAFLLGINLSFRPADILGVAALICIGS